MAFYFEKEKLSQGIIAVDDTTIKKHSGTETLAVNIDDDTLYYDELTKRLKARQSGGGVDVDNTTIKFVNEKLQVQIDDVLNKASTLPVQNAKVTEALETIIDALDDKVDVEVGKGLSSNDYTTEDKEAVEKIGDVDLPEDSDSITDAINKLNTALGKKVEAEDGKGLSSNDYTTADKYQVAKIGDLTKLETTATSDLVSAINEVNGLVSGVETLLASL